MNRRNFFHIAASGLALAATTALGCAQPAPRAQTNAAQNVTARPNIVFILADDLGYKDLGCYGSSFYDTPKLDAFAKSGALFTDGYAACPVCSPTRASLMSGQYQQRTGVTDWIGSPQPDKWTRNTKSLPAAYKEEFALNTVTMAEMLKSAGYTTGFFGKWHLGPEGFWPENQGFDVNVGGWSKGSPSGEGKYFVPYGNPRLTDGPPGELLPDRLSSETCKFIEANQNKPFLAYLAFYEVHNPLMTTKPLEAKYQKRVEDRGLKTKWGVEPDIDINVRQSQDHPVYAGMVSSMDTAAGKVLDKLKELGLDKNTIVVFTSDNGGVATSEGWPTSNQPLRGGKGWLYEGGIREPMMIRWPGVTKPGSIVTVPAISPDFYRTFMDASGAKAPANQPLDGIDLKPILEGKSVPSRPLFWEYPHYGNQGGAPGAVVRDGNWKLIHWFEGDKFELYNLSKDIGEANDLAVKEPKRVQKMRALLGEWQKEVGAQQPTINPSYNPAKPNGRLTGTPRELRKED